MYDGHVNKVETSIKLYRKNVIIVDDDSSKWVPLGTDPMHILSTTSVKSHCFEDKFTQTHVSIKKGDTREKNFVHHIEVFKLYWDNTQEHNSNLKSLHWLTPAPPMLDIRPEKVYLVKVLEQITHAIYWFCDFLW